MKKAIITILLFVLMMPILSEGKKRVSHVNKYRLPTALSKEIQNWSKEKLEYLSSVYASLGERFYMLKHMRDAKACLMYAIQVYPIGQSAQKAKLLLKKYWKIMIP